VKIFITIFLLCSFLYASIKQGDIEFKKRNYLQAIKYYEQSKNTNNPKLNQKLLRSYISIADHYSYIYKFDEAKIYYTKAMTLDKNIAKKKLARVYEKEANLYYKGKKFETALTLYKKSVEYGNENAVTKVNDTRMIIEHAKDLTNDNRKIVNSKSPQWTQAIGRLIIPTKVQMATKSGFKINIKKCSATLVNFDELQSSRIIITASHCISEYDKKVGLLRFIIKTKKNQIIQKYATIYKDSNFDPKLKKSSDYAILILSSAISKKDVVPVNIDKRSFITLQKEYKYHFASLAGFSSDIGDYGSDLTYDPKCEISYYNKLYGESNCSGFKGASGGPVVLTTSKDKKKVEYYFIGVISHFRGKKFDEIYFAPHHIFYKSLQKAINRYNK